jgi:hypothetical protein
MSKPISNIVIVGGGSAGWLVAGLLASELGTGPEAPYSVTLVESPDVATVGVGEGTWPTMRVSLQKIGIPEAEFLNHCKASFKQGTQFIGWLSGEADDRYYHPFSLPAGYGDINLATYWQEQRDRVSFANAVSTQGYLCDRNLAPKQLKTPDYAFVANYGYHLDAGNFAGLLQRHCTVKLGVRHVLDHVTGINGQADEDIASVRTAQNGDIEGDLFVDCTGFAALLLGKHYGIPFISRRDVLFNDSALAVQVPYAESDGPIASQTNATAREAGWIWDIGLQNRRGTGYTYSSAHTTDEEALRVIEEYVQATSGGAAPGSEPRKISFEPGHRARFWHRNCVAVGMSAGFLEPMEASALVMIELAGQMLAEELPATRELMDLVAKRYNDKFLYRWDRIIDFLKLHYVLSHREQSAFWRDNRDTATVPEGLHSLLELWRYQPPWQRDFPNYDEVFSAASYQYVLYGMGFETRGRPTARSAGQAEKAMQLFVENNQSANRIVGRLPSNRELLQQIGKQGLPAG